MEVIIAALLKKLAASSAGESSSTDCGRIPNDKIQTLFAVAPKSQES